MSEIHVDSSGENRAGKSRPVSSIYEQALCRMHYNLSPESSLDGPEAMIPLGSNVPCPGWTSIGGGWGNGMGGGANGEVPSSCTPQLSTLISLIILFGRVP